MSAICPPTFDRRHTTYTANWSAWLIGAVVLATAARGDVFHLTNGGRVEGALVSQDDESYRVRTLAGVMTLRKAEVQRIERKASVLEEYERRAADVEPTAEAHVALARWCREVGYQAGYRQHLRRALALDPECVEARAGLGYVKRDGRWVRVRKGRAAASDEAPDPEQQVAGPASAPASQPEVLELDDKALRVVQEAQQRWSLTIRAIRNNKLETSIPRLVEDGRRRILAITDPLAIRPLMRVLADGNLTCRQVLVEALAAFDEDEATAYLLTIVLMDANADVRRAAMSALIGRRDPRIIKELIRALEGDDRMVRHAAEALAMLGPSAAEAVPYLVPRLTAERVKSVSLTAPQYFGGIGRRFGGVCVRLYVTSDESGRMIVTAQVVPAPPDAVSGPPPLSRKLYRYKSTNVFFEGDFMKVYPVMVGPLPDEYSQRRRVTMFRTEVLEALKAITGQNFGFDAKAWERWLREEGSRPE